MVRHELQQKKVNKAHFNTILYQFLDSQAREVKKFCIIKNVVTAFKSYAAFVS